MSLDYHLQRKSIMSVYAPPEIIFTRGQGVYLYDEHEQHYLDFIAGIGVNSLGYCHPVLVETLKEQADKLWHLSNMFRIPSAEQLAKKITESTFADKVFFANSGTEAIELGLKIIRRYHFEQQTKRYQIIGMQGAFHGRTIAALAAAGNSEYTRGFITDDMGFSHVPFGDIEALKSHISPYTAGVILEPVQGEGGVNICTQDYLQQIRQICDQHDIVLMFDEIQCGLGRSGHLFAYQHYGVTPNILTSAKGLAGGFPIGACLTTDKLAQHMTVGTHGSTFGGNPLATSVALKAFDIINNTAFLHQVQINAKLLQNGLIKLQQKYPNLVKKVRGLGLMLGLQLNHVNNNDVVLALRDKHILIGKAANNTLRFLPPLTIETTHIEQLLLALDETLSVIHV